MREIKLLHRNMSTPFGLEESDGGNYNLTNSNNMSNHNNFNNYKDILSEMLISSRI